MAATKNADALLSAVTTTQTSSAVDTSTHYGDDIYAKLVVAGTPSTTATFTPQYSPDGSAYYNGQTYSAPLVAGTYYWVVSVPVTAKNVKVDFVTQTGGTSSTFTAQLGEVTGV